MTARELLRSCADDDEAVANIVDRDITPERRRDASRLRCRAEALRDLARRIDKEIADAKEGTASSDLWTQSAWGAIAAAMSRLDAAREVKP